MPKFEFNSASFKAFKEIMGSYIVEGVEYAKLQEPVMNRHYAHKVVYEALAFDADHNIVLLGWDVTKWWWSGDDLGEWDGDWEKEVFIMERKKVQNDS